MCPYFYCLHENITIRYPHIVLVFYIENVDDILSYVLMMFPHIFSFILFPSFTQLL